MARMDSASTGKPASQHAQAPGVISSPKQPALPLRRVSGTRESKGTESDRIPTLQRNPEIGARPPNGNADVSSIDRARRNGSMGRPRHGVLLSREADR